MHRSREDKRKNSANDRFRPLLTSKEIYPDLFSSNPPISVKEHTANDRDNGREPKISAKKAQGKEGAPRRKNINEPGSVFDSFPENSRKVEAELHREAQRVGSNGENRREDGNRIQRIPYSVRPESSQRSRVSDRLPSNSDSITLDQSYSEPISEPNSFSRPDESGEYEEHSSGLELSSASSVVKEAMDTASNIYSESPLLVDSDQGSGADFPSTDSDINSPRRIRFDNSHPRSFRSVPRNTTDRHTLPLFREPSVGSSRNRNRKFDMFSRYWRKGELLRPRVAGDFCVGSDPYIHLSPQRSRYSSNLELTSFTSGSSKGVISGLSRDGSKTEPPVPSRRRRAESCSGDTSSTPQKPSIDQTRGPSRFERRRPPQTGSLNTHSSLPPPDAGRLSPESSRRQLQTPCKNRSVVSDV